MVKKTMQHDPYVSHIFTYTQIYTHVLDPVASDERLSMQLPCHGAIAAWAAYQHQPGALNSDPRELLQTHAVVHPCDLAISFWKDNI